MVTYLGLKSDCDKAGYLIIRVIYGYLLVVTFWIRELLA